ncbi:MAG TPA: ATP-binding protein [Rhizomicrobium sp.]|jgi:PAS domain S-box-containing protein|nr:ATP-binding protein [Rhizomicrobium sp.]HWA04856.1 ATP-binding protein [Rhizomicrobium sp.]
MLLLEALIAVLVCAIVAILLLLRAKNRADSMLRNAIAALPQGVAIYDEYDRLYLWNEPYEGVSGPSPRRLRRGVTFRQMIEEDLRDGQYAEADGREREWLEERMAMRAKGEGSRIQDLRNGQWLRVQDRRTADGGTVSICVDITDIKRGEDSFKLMFDNNPVPMWLWEGSPQLRVLDLNNAALAHLGYEREDVESLTVFDLLSGEERPALEAMIKSGLVRPYDGTRIWRPRRRDGTLRYAMPYIHMRPRDGKTAFVAAIVDVTDRMLAEKELRDKAAELERALDRAETASRSKSKFLATMSHELRTPLNAILGFSDVLKKEMFGPIGSLRYKEYAQSIHESGAHLLGVINDILDIAKLDAGELRLHLEPVALDNAVDDCLSALSLQTQRGAIAIRRQIEPAVLMADHRRLRQILFNLVSNAVKFMPTGGEVHIGAATVPDGFAVTVRDTGIGMSNEDIPRALERFGQVDSSFSRKFEGAGLGLPLTKALAELHGATLSIESTPGVGTCVTVLFPPDKVVMHMPGNARTG